MSTPEVSFVPATLLLRPPRVAIMVADDHHWREWTMRALTVASDYWGGGGFILVPYDRETGAPSTRFAEVVRAYDPDHIVTLEFAMSDFEDLYPGSIRFSNVDDEEERGRLIRNAHGEVDDAPGRRARAIVASWCSPMRMIRLSRGEEVRQHETVTKLRKADRSDSYHRGLPYAVIPSPTSRFAASTQWRSDAGMIAAARVGVATVEPHDRPEPEFEVLDWAIAPVTDAPDSLLWTTARPGQAVEQPDWWFRAGQGLLQVSRGYLNDRAAVVVGDSGTDFALALAYDRIIGRGVWLTPTLLDNDDAFKGSIRPALWTMISDLEQDGSKLVVCSTSLTTRQIERVAERLEPDHEFQRYGTRRQRVAEHETVQTRFVNVERGLLEYVIEEHLGTSVLLPMAEDEDGTLNAMTGLESPVPSNLLYRLGSGKVPYWYVDVSLAKDHAPHGRDYPASALTIEEGPFPQVNLRSTNDGVTFDPSSMGFVDSRALLPGRLGRPRLRSLSIRTWVEGMAELHGLGVRLSTPGRQAELVRRRLGSRRDLFDLISSPTLTVLRAFIPLDKPPEQRHPDTVVLGLDPYLSWEAIDALLPGSEEETVKAIDKLTSARLLRRGLVVNCVECGRPSFLDADKLGQQYECPQCATINTLVSERWRKGREPRWFYDLYATFRELLAKHGEVPILASAALSAKSGRGYADTPELEFFEADGGKRVAEIDVIASADREVVLVEAKSTDAFPHGKRAEQTAKLLRIAEVLRADRIVLATTQPQWKQTDVDHLTREAGKFSQFPLRTEVLPGLGT